MLATVAAGRLPLAELVTRRLTLEEAGPALAAMGTSRSAGIAVARPHDRS
jgi:threonine dehydrogenase-like Zn-dependent dehydrogenase